MKKQEYMAPEIKCIPLDNSISLQLESTPPAPMNEPSASVPEYFNNDPLKMA